MRRRLALLLAGLVCGEAAVGAPPRPEVLLVAVGDEQPVFDRFVADLAGRFDRLDVAGVATASASGRVGRRIDAPGDVVAAIRALRERRPAACLVYLTGHGTRAGLVLPRHAPLKPRDLRAALADGCGEAPTVVVASGCFSGVYLRPGIVGANRVVLTAAARDRTSFGCADDRTYTYYDGCFLHAFDAASTWRQLAAATAVCVSELERRLVPGAPPSNPQAAFGRDVRDLPLPAKR